jgi:hypothetical protein
LHGAHGRSGEDLIRSVRSQPLEWT